MISRKFGPIIVTGSSNPDMVATAPISAAGESVMGRIFFVSAGGKGGKQAVEAARLGVEVTIVVNLGPDALVDRVIDTSAAGDLINGSAAVGLALSNELSQSIELACRAASISVTRAGATNAMPFVYEVEI